MPVAPHPVRSCACALLLANLIGCAHRPSSIVDLVPADTTAVLAAAASDFPLLDYVDRANPDMFACWRALEQKIDVAYQIYTASLPGGFAVIDGDLPRDEVETCVAEALDSNNVIDGDIRREGDLTIVPTRWGSVYAAWRGRFVVIGGRDEVAHALTAEASPAWRAALGDLPDREGVVRRRFVAISTDPTFANLLKVRVAQWKLELDGPPSPWPERDLLAAGEGGLHAFGKREVERKRRQEAGLPPDEARAADRVEPLAGRVELRYASAEEATRAGQALATAAFGGDLEASLAAALARLPQSVVGTTLVIRFDRSNFSAVDGATLSAWVARFAPAAKP